MLTQTEVITFFNHQLEVWEEVNQRFSDLNNVLSKQLNINGFEVTISHNPMRIRSSAAKVDKASIAARQCFLCDANRPAQQLHLDWKNYRILVNPFPILPRHFTIIAKEHRPQSIATAIYDMKELALILPDFAIFYNGPACGASAPDHFHFQAVEKSALPMMTGRPIPFGVITLNGGNITQQSVNNILSRLPKNEDEYEPKVNIFCTSETNVPQLTIIPRRKHRPDFYGEDGMLISPASIDLAGVIVAPRLADYENININVIKSIYSQLCFSQSEINNLLNDNPSL